MPELRLRTVTHEGTSDAALALLGADQANLPILVNRLIFDADVLIPLIRMDGNRAERPSAVLWDFVDSATKKRWREQSLGGGDLYAEQVRNLAGGLIVVRVVVGPGNFPYSVAIGTWEATEPVATERLSLAWAIDRSQRADLLIISIDARRDARSWQALRDALVAATEFDRDCPIVIASDLDEPPPNELRNIFSSQSSSGKASDFDPELRAAISGRMIYLDCPLSADTIHELGMHSLPSRTALRSLASQYRSPVLIRDPQRMHTSSSKQLGGAKRPAGRASINKKARRSK